MPLIATRGAASVQGFGEFAQSAAPVYIEDVFSTYLYTGTSATQTITNGIDLSGQGGMVWIKSRSVARSHFLADSVRGATKTLSTDSTAAETTDATRISAFTSSGFSLGSSSNVNNSGEIYTSWTFREQPKFFDVVTYTGTGGTQTVNHSLGIAPGLVIAKRTDSASDWIVFHRSITTNNGQLNSTAAFGVNSAIGISSVTATNITLNSAASATPQANVNGATYVAYLFAHDTATDGLIQCGSASLDVNQSANVTLGWEPQFVLVKLSSTTSDWRIVDTMRGMTMDAASSARLLANSSAAETQGLSASFAGVTTATGFNINFGGAGAQTAIYIAIRRPNKPPTSGTQVYNAIARTGTSSATTVAPGFTTDMAIVGRRSTFDGEVVDRLRGNPYLATNATTAETTTTAIFPSPMWDVQDGFRVGTAAGSNISGTNYINWAFRRAPGFFDVVCYTGTGSNTTVAHNLGVAPELMIVKSKTGVDGVRDWCVYAASEGNTKYAALNTTAAFATGTTRWNSTTPTATVFSVGSNGDVNSASTTYVAYLFASLPGISKVGSYTGNGTSQTINCGFTGGSRFVLIKRTDSTGNWTVFDSARGIVAGNDPALYLNSTAAEVTTIDAVDTDNSGFIVNQDATLNLNVNTATYIFLAIA